MKQTLTWMAKGLVLLILFICTVVIYALLSSPPDGKTNDISRAGESLGGIYKRYNGSVYAEVPSNGFYKIDKADPETFTLIKDGMRNNRQAGKDKNYVYCGNLVLPELDAARTEYLGNSYFSDGTQTWYCGFSTIRNDNLSALAEIFQLVRYRLGYGAKPQSYLNPSRRLPKSSVPYRPLLNADFITDGTQVYYRGERLAQAKPDTLRRIKVPSSSGARPSEHYFADGEHVYYKTQLLPYKDNDKLEVLKFGDIPGRTPYLYDPLEGMVFAATLPFDDANKPYTPLTREGEHIHHVLFTSKNGIFFYDAESGKMQRAGKNVFASADFSALSPYIFWDGKRLIYLQASEERRKGKNGWSLVSRSTNILQLTEPVTDYWQKLGKVRDGFYGTIWRNGSSLWYFSTINLEHRVTKSGPLYHIADNATAEALQQSGIRSSDIERLFKQDKLYPPSHQKLLEAKTQYKNSGLIIVIFIIAAFSLPAMLGLFRAFRTRRSEAESP